MIKLTQIQIESLRAEGLESIVVSNNYTDFPTMRILTKEDFNRVLPLIGLPGDWDTYLAAGNLQDLPRFIEFLKTSVVFAAALKAGQSNAAIRKLVFELIGWLQNGVGEKSPRSILACWMEINTVSRGAIKASVPADAIAAWNQAIDDCMMLTGFKL